MMYVQDYDEKFAFNDWFDKYRDATVTNGCGFAPSGVPRGPIPPCSPYSDWGRRTYADVISPYIKNQQIFQCPNHPRDPMGLVQNTFVTPISFTASASGQA